MSGLLSQDPLRGLLYQEPAPQQQPQGLLGALTMNPLMARQVAAQRAANPRPDVTDIFGYGPTWQSYLQNTNANLQGQIPSVQDSPEVMVQKALGMLGNFGGFGIIKPKPGGIDVFHGTGREIKGPLTPDAPKATGGGLNPYGVFVSPDAKVASRYAELGGKGQGAVYPMKANIQKPLNLSAQEYEALQTYVGRMDRGEKLSEFQQMTLDSILEKAGAKPGKHPIQAIREAGYDSIAKDAGRFGVAEEELLVFDPALLRGRFER
jgi:hypothetical protein